MKSFWMAIAGLCIAVAALLMLRGSFSTAFVVAAIGMIAWFLNYRSQMKAIINAADSQHNESVQTDADEND